MAHMPTCDISTGNFSISTQEAAYGVNTLWASGHYVVTGRTNINHIMVSGGNGITIELQDVTINSSSPFTVGDRSRITVRTVGANTIFSRAPGIPAIECGSHSAISFTASAGASLDIVVAANASGIGSPEGGI
jgi:hypothetical protein